MTDLEKLIRDRQDALRGRPRDWIDSFVERVDWLTVGVIFIVSAPFVVFTLWVLVHE